MSGVAVPDFVADQIMRQRYMEKAQAFSHIDRELQEFDSKLSLVYIGIRVPLDKCPIGALPGRFHIRRDNSEKGVPDTFIPIVNQNGEYTDPDLGIVERLKGQDLHHKNVVEELERRWKAEDKAQKDKHQALKDEFNEAVRERYKSKVRPSILFSDDVKFKNKVKGRNG